MSPSRDNVRVRGEFHVECWRPFKPEGNLSHDGNGQLVWEEKVHNIITTEGVQHILNTVLAGSSQIGSWHCALVESNTTPAAAMTYQVPTFTETTSYDEATRPVYNEAAATTGGTVTNSANKGVFTISATKTMFGAALLGGGTAPAVKAGTSSGGVLLCMAQFSGSRDVVDNDVVNLTYSFSAADDGV